MPDSRFHIERFSVKNFRSIRECTVDLAPLTFVIGPNGSGKSNFVDALRFVPEVLTRGLANAAEDFGGAASLLSQPSLGSATASLEFQISNGQASPWEFAVEIDFTDKPVIRAERCKLSPVQHYERNAAPLDRLFLPFANAPEFHELDEFLRNIRFREPWPPASRRVAYLVRRMSRALGTNHSSEDTTELRFSLLSLYPSRLRVVYEYLRAISPDFERLEVVSAGEILTSRIIEADRSFDIARSSAGLGYAADVLSTIFAPSIDGVESPVIIEEPEAFLHPGAIQVLRDAFVEASRNRQIIVTTHSPSLLDDSVIDSDWIRVVERDEQGTHIRPLNEETKSIIRDRLYSPGQLLQQGGLI